MRILFTGPGVRMYGRLPLAIRKKVDRQLHQLAQDLRHPSVHAKKMSSVGDIWEGRIDDNHRLTFQIVEDAIVVRKVGTHDILKQP